MRSTATDLFFGEWAGPSTRYPQRKKANMCFSAEFPQRDNFLPFSSAVILRATGCQKQIGHSSANPFGAVSARMVLSGLP